ncbi:MAG: ECF transporter S component [Clostridiales bacterium]|nr:ECF transporter S component [Clostridiales bacterium]
MDKTSTRKLALSGLFLALGFLLPFVTGSNQALGKMFLPMHIPILLCGFVCGWPYGLVVGFVTPLFRSAILGMPPMFPTAVSMAFELAAYGFLAGLLYKLLPKKNIYVLVSLVLSMLGGRIVLGIANLILYGASEKTLNVFLIGAFTDAAPGIIIQLVLIPVLIIALVKANLIKGE